MIEKNLPAMNLSEETETLISSLPSCIDFASTKDDTDIILATYPKCGTTWIKALSIALLERSKHRDDPLIHHHPLRSDNPHGIVPVFEIDLYKQSPSPDLTKFSLSSPRLFSTHMPLHTLKEAFKESSCKVVYVCRNMKDALVSAWHFRCSYQKIKRTRSVLDSMFESFCVGVTTNGPYWDHVLSYWRGSLKDPKRVLFLRYEELKTDPSAQIKRLAEFLGCPFTKEEEAVGLVQEVSDLCSLRSLSGMEINKTKTTVSGFDHKDFFRKGTVGDWKNHLTPEMENKIDMIIKEKFQGSGLEF